MSIVVSILSLIVAFLAFWFSFENTKISLFNERFEVYDKIEKFLNGVHPKKYTEIQIERGLLNGLRARASFLYGMNREVDEILISCIEIEDFYLDPESLTTEDPVFRERMGENSSEGIIDYDRQHEQHQNNIPELRKRVNNVFSRELRVTLNPFKSCWFWIKDEFTNLL